MTLKNLSLIKPVNKSKTVQGTALILEQIESHFGKVVNRLELKYMPSFILYVCCLIEEGYASKNNLENGKVNKKEKAIEIMREFLRTNFSADDLRVIGEIIEDLHSSKRIRKVSYLNRTFFFLSKVFLKSP